MGIAGVTERARNLREQTKRGGRLWQVSRICGNAVAELGGARERPDERPKHGSEQGKRMGLPQRRIRCCHRMRSRGPKTPRLAGERQVRHLNRHRIGSTCRFAGENQDTCVDVSKDTVYTPLAGARFLAHGSPGGRSPRGWGERHAPRSRPSRANVTERADEARDNDQEPRREGRQARRFRTGRVSDPRVEGVGGRVGDRPTPRKRP